MCTRRTFTATALPAALLVLSCALPRVFADETTANDMTGAGSEETGALPASPRLLDRMYFSLNGAAFDPGDEQGQVDAEGRAYAWGMSAGYAFNPYVGLDAEFLWFTADYERIGTVIVGTTSNDLRALSLGFNLNLRFSYPLSWCTPFVNLGKGRYSTEVLTKRPGDSGFTWEGPPSAERGSGDLVSAGIAIPIGEKSWVDLTWRRLRLDADFGVYTSGRIDAGGDLLAISLRHGGY